MKTTVSIPDQILQDAERLAKERGLSRSELYAQAIAEYVKGRHFVGVRERLDALYEATPEDSALDSLVERLQAGPLPLEDW